MESPLSAPADAGFRLIETFGFRPGRGVTRGALHVARMARSAQLLGMAFDRKSALALIHALSGERDLRCRLTLAVNGQLEMSTAPMPPKKPHFVFSVAQERLSSGDPWLHHKTTRRALYDDVRAALPPEVDEVIFLNEKDEVCEGTITNIAITTQDGERLTPPQTCGCLPGVYRQSRLNKGLLTEAVLTLSDLRAARSINLVNSLRGSTKARWSPACRYSAA